MLVGLKISWHAKTLRVNQGVSGSLYFFLLGCTHKLNVLSHWLNFAKFTLWIVDFNLRLCLVVCICGLVLSGLSSILNGAGTM